MWLLLICTKSYKINSSPPVPQICVSESGEYWFRQWLVAFWAPSHYLTHIGLLSMEPLETTFGDILIQIQNFSFTKMHPKISSAQWRPFFPGGGDKLWNLGIFLGIHSRFTYLPNGYSKCNLVLGWVWYIWMYPRVLATRLSNHNKYSYR